ncbi:MAG: helix-turn-helix domain-containing protein [Rhodospirillaceae bacterium]
MNIAPITSALDYENALKRIADLMDAPSNSGEEKELDVLATLVAQYEQDRFPIDLPDPIEAIQFRMEQQGWTVSDLQKTLGNLANASDILNGTCELTLPVIRILHKVLGVPAEILISDPKQPPEKVAS